MLYARARPAVRGAMTEVVKHPAGPRHVRGRGDHTPLRSRRAEVWSASWSPTAFAVLGLVVLGLLVLAAIFGPASARRRQRAGDPQPVRRAEPWTTGSAPTTSAATCSAGCSWVAGHRCRSASSRRDAARPRPCRSGSSPASTVGRTDGALMRLDGQLFAFPAILLAIAIVAVRGPGLTNVMIAIGVVYTPIFARIARGSVDHRAQRVYVRGRPRRSAHRRHGSPPPHPAQHRRPADRADVAVAGVRHPVGGGAVVPRARRPAAAAVVGRMLADGAAGVSTAPWIGVFPGLGDPLHGAGVQPARRRTARCPRPAARRAVIESLSPDAGARAQLDAARAVAQRARPARRFGTSGVAHAVDGVSFARRGRRDARARRRDRLRARASRRVALMRPRRRRPGRIGGRRLFEGRDLARARRRTMLRRSAATASPWSSRTR